MFKTIKFALYLIVMTICVAQASGCTHNDNIVSVSAHEFEKAIQTDSVQLLDVQRPVDMPFGVFLRSADIK